VLFAIQLQHILENIAFIKDCLIFSDVRHANKNQHNKKAENRNSLPVGDHLGDQPLQTQ
jgi:hypothetical protein